MSWWRSPEAKAKWLRGRTTSSDDWGRNTPQWKQAGEGENLDLALLLFYLPALEELSLPLPFSKKECDLQHALGVGYDVDDGLWPLGTPPRASRLTTLHVRLQYAPETVLETILAATPLLRTLHVVLHQPSTTAPVDCAAVRRALYHVEPTLESLTLAVSLFADEACDVESLGQVLKGRLGGDNFAVGFPALKSLHVSLSVLFGQSSSNWYVLAPGDTDWWSEDEDDAEGAVKGIKSADDPYHDMLLAAAAELCALLPPSLEVLTINDDLWFYDALPAWSGGKRTLGLLMAFLTGSPITPQSSQGVAAAATANQQGGSRCRGFWMGSLEDRDAETAGSQRVLQERRHLVLGRRARYHADRPPPMGCASQGLECRDIRLSRKS
ncbi:hypothetical protein PG991_015804 [Apiospora marii]|uniref:Uncharacterized protein n=1 Tax=Apiospora marii TaxID=335849 RepID=A0ABR1R2Q8_9PEZI